MEVIIENVKPEDVEELQKLYYETWMDTYRNDNLGITKENLEYRYKDMLSKESIEKIQNVVRNMTVDQKFLAAKVGEKIVGALFLEKEKDQNRLQGLYILPEYQNIGIGKKLWEETKKFFDMNRKTILEVVEYNERAINFYKKLGFIDTGKRYLEDRVTDEKIVKKPLIEMDLLYVK